MHPYTLIRSDRKTVSLQITREAALVVRAPIRLSKREIDKLVEARREWIHTHLAKQQLWNLSHAEPTEADEAALRKKARELLPPLVDRYAKLMGLLPEGIKITAAKARYGSCSSENSLCFSFRLMRFPMPAIEYVVVHELAHIRHKNHGRAFYALIETVLPDHKTRRAMLKSDITQG